MLADEPVGDNKIIASNKSNPLAFWLSTSILVSRAIKATVKPLLELWDEVLKIQEHTLALQNKKLLTAEHELEVMKKIDDYEDSKIKQIVEDVSDKYHKPKIERSKINEAKARLRLEVPKLYKFIRKKGEVDATESSEDNRITSNLNLAPQYLDVQNFDSRVQKQLEAINVKGKDELKPDVTSENDKPNMEWKKREIKEFLSVHGIETDGKKPQLIERYENYVEEIGNTTPVELEDSVEVKVVEAKEVKTKTEKTKK